MADKKGGLGRGIDALFQSSPDTSTASSTEKRVEEIPVSEIRPNPYQPRKGFDEEALQELAQSIEKSGVLQPILVRKSTIKGYEVIAGERRLRASKLVGLDTIPAIVETMNDEEMIEVSILENLQREDLSALEEAEAYKVMMEKLDLTQAEVAERLGKSRPYITNSLRLLKLPRPVKDLLQEGDLSMGQARAILGLKNEADMVVLAQRAVDQHLTVRQLEKEVQAMNEEKDAPKQTPTPKVKKTSYIIASENSLMEKFGTDVSIRSKKSGQGKIEIDYTSEEDLTRILDILEIRID